MQIVHVYKYLFLESVHIVHASFLRLFVKPLFKINKKFIFLFSEGKKKILDIMNQTISEPRKNKTNLPLIESLQIPVQKRGKFLGVGGVNIKKLTLETGK